MKNIKIVAVVVGFCLCFIAVPVEAQGVWGACEGGASSSAICGDETEAEDIVKRLINVFLYAIGALSVIMIIFSGFKYVNSRGDAEGVKSAKNTLTYSVTGLIVALLAFTIVNFVIESFNQTSNMNSTFLSKIGAGESRR